jgi:hypothetical protein
VEPVVAELVEAAPEAAVLALVDDPSSELDPQAATPTVATAAHKSAAIRDLLMGFSLLLPRGRG